MNERNSIDRHIGGRIRERRLELSLSVAELETRLRMAQGQLQKHESGLSRVMPAALIAAALALDVPIGYFFEGSREA